MDARLIKKCALVLLVFCAALICAPVMAAATPATSAITEVTVAPSSSGEATPTVSGGPSPSPSSAPSPAPSATPPPTPTPTVNVQELIESAELPEYGLLKEGDSGDMVLLLQQRLYDLGYFTYRVTGEFGSLTKNAVKRFQTQNGIDADGVVGGQTNLLLFTNYAQRSSFYNARIPTPTPAKPKPTGALIEWKKMFSMTNRRSGEYKVTDYYTGISYTMVRVGGYNHMDVEPKTKKDCDAFKRTYGGTWSWSRRPVLVRVNGKTYAGSINGMPHGYETVRNNGMTGQVCIHFLNSRTHETNAVDSAHQRCVRIAAGR